MKLVIFFLALSTSAFAGETFHLKGFGMSITTPTGWFHDAEDTFGYVLRDPTATKPNQKIRVHYADKEAKSVQEAAQFSLKRINEGQNARKQALEEDFSSGLVTTRSGIKGWKSAHGFTRTSKVPYIVHYYFRPPSGRIICICAYVMYDAQVERDYDRIILDSLELTR